MVEEMRESTRRFWRNVPVDHGSCGIAFVVDRRSVQTREALTLALRGLCDLDHRTGKAFGAGDGAGVMFETHSLQGLLQSWLPQGIETRAALSAGMFFFQGMSPEEITNKQNRINHILGSRGIHVHAWRSVPVIDEALPGHVVNTRPGVWEVLYSPKAGLRKDLYREMLFHCQQQIERELGRYGENPEGVAVVSLNPDTLVYKARATGRQLQGFYSDLSDPLLTPRQAATHARMGTNTEVTWPNTQPAGVLMHNGEINTDRVVRGAERDRQIRLAITPQGEDSISVGPWKSDSRAIDAMVRRSLALGLRAPKAIRRLMLPALDDARRYPKNARDLHRLIERTQGPLSAVQGPAAFVVMTGHTVTVAMDPMGLRTFSLCGTPKLVVGSSEIGSPPIPLEELEWAYALEGGDIAVVKDGACIFPNDVEASIARTPRLKLVGEEARSVFALPPWQEAGVDAVEGREHLTEEQIIGLWNRIGGEQHVLEVIQAMLAEGKEPIVGMGDDRPLAVLSPGRPRIAEFFKQIVAVVTNPSLDALREGEAMDLTTYLGRSPKQVSAEDPTTFAAEPEFKLESPILTPDQWSAIQSRADEAMPEHVVIDTSVEANSGEDLKHHLEGVITQVVGLAERGDRPIIVLSDRGSAAGRCFVPPVLLVSALDEALKSRGTRDNVRLVIDTADALEAHDMALLIGQGADAVHPYLLWEMVQQQVGVNRKLREMPRAQQAENLKKALDVMLKTIMAKMGIISINGYRGSCLFEAIGIGEELTPYLPHNVSRIGGIGWQDCFNDQRQRVHDGAGKLRRIEEGSAHGRRVWGLMHQLSLLRGEESQSSEAIYQDLLRLVDQRDPIYLRDLLGFVPASERGSEAIPLEEVESAEEIIRNHFRGAAMSDGALGPIGHAASCSGFQCLGFTLQLRRGGRESSTLSRRTVRGSL